MADQNASSTDKNSSSHRIWFVYAGILAVVLVGYVVKTQRDARREAEQARAMADAYYERLEAEQKQREEEEARLAREREAEKIRQENTEAIRAYLDQLGPRIVEQHFDGGSYVRTELRGWSMEPSTGEIHINIALQWNGYFNQMNEYWATGRVVTSSDGKSWSFKAEQASASVRQYHQNWNAFIVGAAATAAFAEAVSSD